MVQIKKGILTELHTQKSDQFQVKLAVILTNKNQETHKTKQNKPQNKNYERTRRKPTYEQQTTHDTEEEERKKTVSRKHHCVISISTRVKRQSFHRLFIWKKKTEFRKSPQYCINQNSIELQSIRQKPRWFFPLYTTTVAVKKKHCINCKITQNHTSFFYCLNIM